MKTNGVNGHIHPMAAGRDDGETRRQPCPRTTWCIEERDHAGPCIEVVGAPHAPPDYGPKRREPKAPAPVVAPAAVVWPDVGATFIDSTARVLTVLEVRPKCGRGRNVVGLISGAQGYACDLATFLNLWSPA